MLASFLTTAALAAIYTHAFTVNSPTGPASSEIICGSYASVSWDAASMNPETDHYDVALLLAADNTVVAELVKAFPQDDPPIGFANFYPSMASQVAGEGVEFVIKVTGKGKEGQVLEEAVSPPFSLPVCPSDSSSLSEQVSSDVNNSSSVTNPEEEEEDFEESDVEEMPEFEFSDSGSEDSIPSESAVHSSELPETDNADDEGDEEEEEDQGESSANASQIQTDDEEEEDN